MAGLTKQHFEEIAKILKYRIDLHKSNNANKIKVLSQVAYDLADYFKTQNPLFNKERFLKACLE